MNLIMEYSHTKVSYTIKGIILETLCWVGLVWAVTSYAVALHSEQAGDVSNC